MGPAHAPPRRILLALLAAALAALLAAALAALSAAVARGAVAGPELTLSLGGYALVAGTTEHPDCLPLPRQCFIPRPTFRVPQPRYYAVWAGRITYPAGPASFATVRGRELLRVEVGAGG